MSRRLVQDGSANWPVNPWLQPQRTAAVWNDGGRASGLLLAGEALVGAVAWAGTHMPLPYEREFLDASLATRTTAERERKQTQRIRLLAVVAGVVAVAAIILAFFAWTSRRRWRNGGPALRRRWQPRVKRRQS